jgi:signal transduction histidine kinase
MCILAGGVDDYYPQIFLNSMMVFVIGALSCMLSREIRLRNERLLYADRRKDEFLAMLAHELRNPLSAISASYELLKDAGESSEVRNMALDIQGRQLKHISRLVDDLLDVSRVTRGKFQLNIEGFWISDSINSTVNALKFAFASKNLNVQIEQLEDYWIEADRTRVEQMFVNILQNAAKFSEIGGHINIRVRARCERYVCVNIIDKGIGMDPFTLAQVFDLFVQGQTTLDRAHGGLGIGLTLARGIAELHRGSITATSPGLGKGCDFEIAIPYCENSLQAEEKALEYSRLTLNSRQNV